MAAFIEKEKSKIVAEAKQNRKRYGNSNARAPQYPPLTRSPPKRSPLGSANRRSPKSEEPAEEYILFSDSQNSEIFELPLTATGDLDLNTVKTVASARTVGVYTIRDGRKRLMPSDPSGKVIRPASGWKNCTYFPLIPPRSSRPGTARSEAFTVNSGKTSLSNSQEFALKPLSPSLSGPTGFTPRNVESLPVVSIGQNNSLLDGSYDEAAAALEFQQAVAEFRGDRRVTPRINPINPGEAATGAGQKSSGTGAEMPVLPHEIPMETKLSELEKMFEQKTNMTAVERLYLEQARSASRMIAASHEFDNGVSSSDEDEIFKTKEDYELEEERNEFRDMLLDSISSHSMNVEKNHLPKKQEAAPVPLEVTVEKQLTPRPPSVPRATPSACKSELTTLKVDYEPMWLPTPGVNFDDEVASTSRTSSRNTELRELQAASSSTSVEEIQRPDIQESRREDFSSPKERIFQETVHQTIYSDGTVVNNVVTVELNPEYDEEQYYDFEHDNNWQEELLRQQEQEQDLFEAHSRRFSQEMEHEQDNGLRPASRSSIYTDDDLAENYEMTFQLNEIESRYLPDNDDY